MIRKYNLKDMRLIYLMIFSIMFIASIAPVVLPLPVLKWVQDFYNTLQNGGTVSFATPARTFGGVKDGSRVLILFSSETSSLWGDMSESTMAVFRYLVQKHAHLLIYCSSSTLQNILEIYVFPLIYGSGNIRDHPLYGTEVVFLGFVSGGDALFEAWRTSIRGFTPRDIYNNLLSSLTMMNNIDSTKTDIDLIVGFDARAVDSTFVSRDNNLVLLLGGTDSASYLAYYYTAGFVKGAIYGQNQGAQFEILSGIAGKAMSYAENTLFLATAMTLIIVGSNIQYLRNRGGIKKQETGGLS